MRLFLGSKLAEGWSSGSTNPTVFWAAIMCLTQCRSPIGGSEGAEIQELFC